MEPCQADHVVRHFAGMYLLALACSSGLAKLLADKTAWFGKLTTNRRVRTLRVPIDPDEERKLYTGALSPDGRFGAFVGNLGGGSETESIHLFDLGTGDLYLHLSDLQVRSWF